MADNPKSKSIQDLVDDSIGVVNMKDLNESYKYLGYLGGTALAGLGVGLGFSGLKGLVDRAYRNKLRKGILESGDVEETYGGRVTPVTNSFVIDETGKKKKKKKYASVKTDLAIAGAKDAGVVPTRKYGESTIGEFATGAAKVTDDIRKYFTKRRSVAMSSDNKLRDIVAGNMSRSPQILHTLAFTSLLPLFAAGVWGGSSLGKAVSDDSEEDKESRLKKERAAAEKEYNAAAKELRSVMREKSSMYRYKTAAGAAQSAQKAKKVLQGLRDFFAKHPKTKSVTTLLGLPAATAGLSMYGTQAYIYGKHGRPTEPSITVDSPNEITGNYTLDKILPWLLGIGALGASVPTYKFVQSLRNGYKDQKDSVSDVSRATQAWNAIHNESNEDYATLRAALEDEPSLSKLKG